MFRYSNVKRNKYKFTEIRKARVRCMEGRSEERMDVSKKRWKVGRKVNKEEERKRRVYLNVKNTTRAAIRLNKAVC